MKDGMHMITACFARVSLRCTRRTSMPFLLIIQGVRPTSKTRNQLQLKNDVDSYNENRQPASLIQMIFDFTDDLTELELASA
jgi:hypothetical protein